jgi:hypothetical protein
LRPRRRAFVAQARQVNGAPGERSGLSELSS